MPKGLRLDNPKFNLCVMQEEILGDFKIRLFYEDCVEMNCSHRYYVECVDLTNWVKILIDSNVIDKSASITMSDAIAKTKHYFKKRFNDKVVDETFINH